MANDILILENDDSTIQQVSDALGTLGYTVASASSADEGLSQASSLGPALILLNLATPGTNGLEICKKIHSDDSMSHIPIILLTLREGKFDPVYTKLYGIVAFLNKPFENEALVSMVQEHAPLSEAPAEEAPPEEDISEGFADEGMPMDEDATVQFDAGAIDTGGEADDDVFSVDDTEQSLGELQDSFIADESSDETMQYDSTDSDGDDWGGIDTEEAPEDATVQFNAADMDTGADDSGDTDAGVW